MKVLIAIILLIFAGCASETLFQKGVTLTGQKKYQEAINIFEQILQKDPDHTEAMYNLGAIYYALKDEDKALEFFRKTVAINKLYDSKYHHMKKFIRDTNKSWRIERVYRDAWYNIAAIEFNKKHYLESLKAASYAYETSYFIDLILKTGIDPETEKKIEQMILDDPDIAYLDWPAKLPDAQTDTKKCTDLLEKQMTEDWFMYATYSHIVNEDGIVEQAKIKKVIVNYNEIENQLFNECLLHQIKNRKIETKGKKIFVSEGIIQRTYYH